MVADRSLREGVFTPFPIYSDIEAMSRRLQHLEERLNLEPINLPNKAPEPTTTAVTSPAAQEPRQP